MKQKSLLEELTQIISEASLEKLDEVIDDKEVAAAFTRLLGLFRIESQKVGKKKSSSQIGTIEYKLGWADAEVFFNKLVKKEVAGVKTFRK